MSNHINFVGAAEVKQAFAQHLMKYCQYSKVEAEMAVSDFPDPYNNCYLCEEYVDDCEIEGEAYEMYASYTEMCCIGMDIPMFCFYTCYRCSDIPDQTVCEYQKAHKLYQQTDLNEEDFPACAFKEHETLFAENDDEVL